MREGFEYDDRIYVEIHSMDFLPSELLTSYGAN
jgi:hypothetical protein